jgi:C-terminal processing protease CtpA/Prc
VSAAPLRSARAAVIAGLAVACSSTVSVGPVWPGGIGAILGYSSEGRRLTVREVPAETPAADAGLRPGDEVVAIDDRGVAGMTVDEIVAALRGEVGSTVRLRVHRGEESFEVVVRRSPYR